MHTHNELLGKASAERPKGEIAVIHANSTNQSKEVICIANKIKEIRPSMNFVFTSNDSYLFPSLGNNVPKETILQLLPIDRKQFVRKFYDYWKPNILIVLENEHLPNLFLEAEKRGIPLLNVNALLLRAYEGIFPSLRTHLISRVLDCCSMVITQSDDISHNFFKLLKKPAKILTTGPLKMCVPKVGECEGRGVFFRDAIKDRPVWMVVNLHKEEIKVVFQTHMMLLEKYPNLLLLVAPKDYVYDGYLAKICKKNKLSFGKISEKPIPDQKDSVFVLDNLEEVDLLNRVSTIVLIGGSLFPKSMPYNPLELVRMGCVVLHGNYIANMEYIYKTLDLHECSLKVSFDAKDIFNKLSLLVNEKGFPNDSALKMSMKGPSVFANSTKTLNCTLEKIFMYLEG